MSQTFKPITQPLHGTSLIEASAGTGKTYNMAALFARLVLLEHIPVAHILVVTFTKAATAELKTRLRARLNEALAALQNNADAETPDAVLAELLHEARQRENDAQLQLRLQGAINQFDGAAIYTIHGFCQRVLTDYAFLCQCPFDTETATADPQLLRTFAEDYWRRHISHDAELAPLVAASGLTPQQWVYDLGALVNRTDVHIRPATTVSLAESRRALAATWHTLTHAFADIQAAFWRLHPKLNGTSYRKATFDSVFAELADAVCNGEPRYAFSKIDKLTSFDADVLHHKTKKGQHLDAEDVALLAPLADFGAAYVALAAAEAAAVLQVQLDCLADVRTAMSAHKRNSHQRSFDDLLADVATALSAHNPQAAPLAAALAHDWQIALVDECQDTDPLQYHIFKTAFADQGRPLLMVGDPKQAIYSFRGADIHAYLQAAADTAPEQRYTLLTNYRSHQQLLQSVGHLFTGKSRPFVLEGIDYSAVQAHRSHSRLSPAPAALSIRWLHDQETDAHSKEPLPNKDTLSQRAANWCADEIADTINRGLSGHLQLDGQALQAGHIAVLVRTHNEGKMVADALRIRGVASVSLGNQSVYASAEAGALCALLRFWLRPQQTNVLRYVLGSVLYAWTAAQLTALNTDETVLNQWLNRADEARERWQQHGVYAALQWFAGATELETGLLRRRAERSLTNFWQLAELLATAAADLPTQTALLPWLEAQIHQPQRHSDDALLRLESDAALVKIVTMHAAKGLEYPVVFCPFVWDGQDATRATWHIIHRHGVAELVHQDMLTDTDKAVLQEEHMGEMLRLYYVAFTRACEQLVLYAGASGSLRDNPFAYLLDGQRDGRLQHSRDFWTACKNQWVSTLHRVWQDRLDAAPADTDITWCTGAPPAAQVAAQTAPATPYQALMVPLRTFQTERYTSFTALSRHTAATTADDEELTPIIDTAEAETVTLGDEETPTEPETSLLAFARGMNAGLCLHALLETTDFSKPAAAQADAYPPLLARFGFDTAQATSLHEMIDAVRQVALFPGSTLADMGAERYLAEMSFMLHVRDFALPALQSWLAQTHLRLPEICVQSAHSLDFATVNGFLNGAIDLVCEDAAGRVCIIDYKSNHLGNRRADYHQANMDAAMAEHHYYLQALIYSIAVARLLALQNKLPATIGVRYLFVRGLGTENDNGVWRWDIATADLRPWLRTHDKD